MKKILKFIFTFIFLFIVFPFVTKAATELSASTQNPVVGDILYVQLEANYGKNLKISDFHVYVDYDTSYFEMVQVKWVKSRTQMGTHEIQPGRVYVDKINGDWSSGPVLQLELKVLKAGSTRINIVETQPAKYVDGSTIAQTMAGIVINSVNPNTNTLLSKLYVQGYNMQPAFKQSQLEYNLIVPANVEQIEIIARKSDSTQTVVGAGIKQLRYGPNKFKIVVTAQNKDSRTYEIVITRTDTRTGDLTLKTLQVSGTNIRVVEGQKVYEATVSRSVDSVLIAARTNDSMATLTGTGQKKLEIGLNTFEILVQSSNGLEEIYTINITRSTEEIQGDVLSSKLKILKVNSLVLNVAEDNKVFLYGIDKNIDALSIDAIPESSTATVEIVGNEKLQVGTNTINIKVTQVLEDGVPATEETPGKEPVVDETTYTLVVYKNPDDATGIDSLDKITGEDNYVYTTIDSGVHLLSKDKVQLLVNNDKTLYYNVVNMYNGLLYQVKLPTEMEVNNIDLKVKKLSSSDMVYSTNLPVNTELTIYLEQKYLAGSDVQIYSYNEGSSYKLITAGLEVKDGYVTFLTNGDTHYVITTRDLIKIESSADKILNIIKGVLIGVAIGVIAILVVPRLFKKKTRIGEKEEPLY